MANRYREIFNIWKDKSGWSPPHQLAHYTLLWVPIWSVFPLTVSSSLTSFLLLHGASSDFSSKLAAPLPPPRLHSIDEDASCNEAGVTVSELAFHFFRRFQVSRYRNLRLLHRVSPGYGTHRSINNLTINHLLYPLHRNLSHLTRPLLLVAVDDDAVDVEAAIHSFVYTSPLFRLPIRANEVHQRITALANSHHQSLFFFLQNTNEY